MFKISSRKYLGHVSVISYDQIMKRRNQVPLIKVVRKLNHFTLPNYSVGRIEVAVKGSLRGWRNLR